MSSLTPGTAASGPDWETGGGVWRGDEGRGHTTGGCHHSLQGQLLQVQTETGGGV